MRVQQLAASAVDHLVEAAAERELEVDYLPCRYPSSCQRRPKRERGRGGEHDAADDPAPERRAQVRTAANIPIAASTDRARQRRRRNGGHFQVIAAGRVVNRSRRPPKRRYDEHMQDGDIVADRREDASYIIRRWRSSDGALLPIDGHEETYEEEEMYRRLNVLRKTGDTYVRDQPGTARLIQP